MADSSSDKPPRRLRYRGANPRQFHEKYKEHHADKYPDEIRKVVGSGRTPVGTHRPILVSEILEILAPQPGEIAVDCTIGYGGHAAHLLAAVQPGGRLLGIDVDPIELPKTEARLRASGCPPESLIVRRMNFAGVSSLILNETPVGADALLADLGLSSMQLDDPERGFSFKVDGPLDMRMNPGHGQSASALLSKIDEAAFAKLLAINADEPHAANLSQVILEANAHYPLQSTTDLANIVADFIRSRKTGTDELVKTTVRRVFQALRIAVNDEFGALDSFLRQLPACMNAGGRIAVLSFHSGEDRRVKRAFKDGFRDGIYSRISHDVIRPSPDEQRANPRSSSAKLRFAIRSATSN